VPTALTFLATRKSFAAREAGTQFSIVGLFAWQWFTWQMEGTQIFGLGIALGVMLVNVRLLGNLTSAAIANGFGILLICSTLWQIRAGGIVDQITFGMNSTALIILSLFVFSHWLQYRRDRQINNLNLNVNLAYAQAFDLWAVFLSAIALSLQTLLAFLAFSDRSFFPALNPDLTQELFTNLWLSIGLIAAGLIYRAWQQPVFWAEWGIAWGLELLISVAIAISDGSVIS
jgi:hypothetical protein